MDYFFDNPQALAMHGSFYPNLQGIGTSTSNSPKNANAIFQYANANMNSFQPIEQSWAPLDFDDLAEFAEDEPQISAPDSTASSTDTEKGIKPNTKMRRRAQNRASQRAFRERKERHLKGLEYQLETLNEKHQDLLQSYMKQSESVVKLNSRLSELRSEIKSVKSRKPQTSAPSSSTTKNHKDTGDRFDAFSFTSAQMFTLDGREDSAFWQDDTQLDGPGGTAGENNGLPGFEDLLHLN